MVQFGVAATAVSVEKSLANISVQPQPEEHI